MKHLGISVDVRCKPPLDIEFIPLFKYMEAFKKTASEPFSIAVERSRSQVAVYHTEIHGTDEAREADIYLIDRLVKMLLWQKGGFKVYLCGNEAVCAEIADRYRKGGQRDFDADFMEGIYGKPFEVVRVDDLPNEKSDSHSVGRHTDGCRIGFDAGGSDRKVSAVIDGECVFSEEVVWHPKITEDPKYHFDGILDAMKTAASHMPRVDGIGVSSAGIYIDNRTKAASLFLKVPRDLFKSQVEDIYIRAAKEFGDVPLVVCNDGDVTALAGAMSLDENNILGIAMGTSEAAGYVDEKGNIAGWLNELAFAPVDANPNAMMDEWSHDIGVGCKYFSQDAVIKLSPVAGIDQNESDSPAEKLKVVQALMEEGDERAADIYKSIGIYLGHSLALYSHFYGFEHILLLGRVVSGRGGDIILQSCKDTLAEEYPSLAQRLKPTLPDERFRRVGQSAAAASLPRIR